MGESRKPCPICNRQPGTRHLSVCPRSVQVQGILQTSDQIHKRGNEWLLRKMQRVQAAYLKKQEAKETANGDD